MHGKSNTFILFISGMVDSWNSGIEAVSEKVNTFLAKAFIVDGTCVLYYNPGKKDLIV